MVTTPFGRQGLNHCNLNLYFLTDASIRTHERTQDPFAAEDNDLISETLRDRLEDLPPPEQPEREINIITLRKDRELGLGWYYII